MALTLAVCVSTDPPRVVHLFVPDPDLDHVCSVCGEVDNEDRDGFDMWSCGWTAGWVHRYCHDVAGCTEAECDPSHE